ISAVDVTANDSIYSGQPTTQSVLVSPGATITATVEYVGRAVPPTPATSAAVTVTMPGLPNGVQGAVTVTGPGGYAQWLTGPQTLTDLVPGPYTFVAANVSIGSTTYSAAPSTQTVSVAPAAAITVGVTYTAVAEPAPSVGTLNVTLTGLPAGAAAAVTVAGVGGFHQAITGTLTMPGLVPGEYVVTAASVTIAGVRYEPFTTSQTATVSAGAIVRAAVTYSVAPSAPALPGSLLVNTSGLPGGAAFDVTVSGPSGYSQQLTQPRTLSGLEAGSYTVAARGVVAAGTTYMPQQSNEVVSVAGGVTTVAVVAYAPLPPPPLPAPTTGNLTITVAGLATGLNASVTVTGPGGVPLLLTGTRILNGLVPGTYTVAASSIGTGGTTYAPQPAAQAVAVAAGSSSAATVLYAAIAPPPPAVGGLAVTVTGVPSGTTGSVTVTGPGGFSRVLTATQSLTGLVPGTYTISVAVIVAGGYTYAPTPSRLTQLINAGSSPSVSVIYTPTSGGLVVTLTGLPSGAGGSVTVTGSGGYAQWFSSTQTLTSLAPGSYAIAAGNATIGGTVYSASPASQTRTVIGGAASNATVTYTAVPPTTGALSVTVSGLPSEVGGRVTVTGPAAFSQPLAATRTLSGLVGGNYTITAATVTSGSTTYAPVLATQTRVIVAGTTVSAAVTYAALPPPSGLPNLAPGFQARTMVVMGTTYKYQIFVPQGYTPSQPWPVLVFLHGSGESGTDGVKETTVGLGPYVQSHTSTFPAIVVFPQVPPLNGGGPLIQLADSIDKTALDLTLQEVHADSTRIYVTGLSQGGDFTWDLAYQGSTRYAAVVPIAGSVCGTCVQPGSGLSQDAVVTLVAQRLQMIPIWVFHGSADPSVSVVDDRNTVAAFQALGSPIKYTEYPGMGHNVWDVTYADPNLWTWLFAQHR
ncbi:MAG: hypothetical protein ACRELE_02590, partial [Gemmatimonadales bacterium]